jgi:hypothetical protein
MEMDGKTLVRLRLAGQCIAGPRCGKPEEAVVRLAAVQAQDYLGALWAIGLRCRDAAQTDVERSLARRAIVRTWPLRGTLHFVASADVRWMLELTQARVLAGNAKRYRDLGLDAAVFSRARTIFMKALRGGGAITREAMFALLKKKGISPAGQRGFHILGRLALEGMLCFGAREGKQHTFVLLDEWAPSSRSMSRAEAVTELARRYFLGHGPATVQDFSWWSGLTASESRIGLEGARSNLAREMIDGAEHWMAPNAPAASVPRSSAVLLPPFDELLVGYKDRSAVVDPAYTERLSALLSPTIFVDGSVAGTWKRAVKTRTVEVSMSPFQKLSASALRAVSKAAARYGRFIGGEAVLV